MPAIQRITIIVPCLCRCSYNILADNLSKCKRRIDIRRLESVSRSQGASDQFVVHVNGDYDYLFDSVRARDRLPL